MKKVESFVFFFCSVFTKDARVTNAVYVKRACTRTGWEGGGGAVGPCFFSIPPSILRMREMFFRVEAESEIIVVSTVEKFR